MVGVRLHDAACRQNWVFHNPRGFDSNNRPFRRAYISLIPYVSGAVPVVTSCVEITVPAITFGSMFVPTMNVAAPRSPVWCVCDPSRLGPISPAPDLPVNSILPCCTLLSLLAVLRREGGRDSSFVATCRCLPSWGMRAVVALAHPEI